MKRFITYFDLLGYRNFLERNESTIHKRVIEQFYVHIDSALNRTGKYHKSENGNFVNDLTGKIVSFANYSDTVILWTETDTEDEFNAILEASHECNWRMNLYHFPIRGILIYDELFPMNYSSSNKGYHVNTFFGKGLIKAHDGAEKQQWAGMVIDDSVIEKITNNENIKNKCVSYDIPYKDGTHTQYAMKLAINLNDTSLKNTIKDIENNFKRHNKWDNDVPSLKEKLKNTIDFITYLKEKNAG